MAEPVNVVAPGQPVRAYTVNVTCRADGAVLVHVATGVPGTSTGAVARCPTCERRWHIDVEMRDVTRHLGHRPAHPDDCTCRPCQRRRTAA